MQHGIILRFTDKDTRQSNVFAQSLKEAIRYEAPDAEVEQVRDNSENQDFGTTLGVILAGPAVVAIARGVEQWLARHHGVKLEISTPAGKIIATNVTAASAAEIIKSTASGGLGK